MRLGPIRLGPIKWRMFEPGMLEHFREQFHRQPDHIGRAAVQQVDPFQSVLKAERAGFTFPCIGVEVGFQLLVGDLVHTQDADRDFDVRLIAGSRPDAKPAVDAVLASSQPLQHFFGMVAVGRLAENHPQAFGDRIAADDDAGLDFGCNVGRFLHSEPRDQFGRRFPTANPALGPRIRRDHLKVVARLPQQFATSR